MIDEKEIKLIKNKFQRFILEGKIQKPKPNKKKFFKNKSESSLLLAKELVERQEHLDWGINISYYSMFYNAVSLLAQFNVDLSEIDESVHVLTYQALVFYFYINDKKIEKQYLEDFKSGMNETDKRLKNLAKQKSEEILASYRHAKE